MGARLADACRVLPAHGGTTATAAESRAPVIPPKAKPTAVKAKVRARAVCMSGCRGRCRGGVWCTGVCA